MNNLKIDTVVGKDFQYTFKGKLIPSEKSGIGDKNGPCPQLAMEAMKEKSPVDPRPDRLPIDVSPPSHATSP